MSSKTDDNDLIKSEAASGNTSGSVLSENIHEKDSPESKIDKSLAEKEELIRKLEALDSSVVPDKDEILRRLKADSSKKKGNSNSMGNSVLLTIGLFFQFIFTVSGGGMLISGLIAGFNVHWDRSLKNGIADISIVLVAVGVVFFIIGIGIGVALYKSVQKKFKGQNK